MGISSEFQALLDGGATTICRCWRMVRKDGVSFGFTDHDRDLDFGGQVYLAGSGMDASALESSTGLSVDNGQAVGALSAVGLQDADILAGKFDRAEVVQWLVNWRDVSVREMVFRGSLGEIRRGATGFEVELRSLAEGLNKPLGRGYVPGCDAVLGDARCGVDLGLAGRVETVSVLSVVNARRVQVDAIPAADLGWFANGHMRWVSGANAGVVSIVKVDAAGVDFRDMELWEELRAPVAVGDVAELVVGCDKRHGTCGAKFSNLLNFRGFPTIPGEDWVADFPRSDGTNTGGSLLNG
ncbi:MAG: DUF2163 domain-containing protein [Rhodobacteraceae bacterium]|nr:DUF2163 domain-containing protein [Paracoccaceae bacterium]